MRVGDLVRPKSFQFREQVGIVINVGFLGSIGVRLMSGRTATYNKGVLEVISESRQLS
jgi:hypothetical protein